ncbi:MAG: histidinol-phosphate transaminase [Spirochaetaceae bacterium]|nr:histidinol-phosphate transaminase [Spirochaetaceae bacterium]
MKDLIRDNIKNLIPYSCARDEFSGVAEVYLDANENYYDYSGKGYNRYPDPHCMELREQIQNKMGLPTINTVIGNGSDELIDNLIRIFCEPNKDSILIMPPTYGAYKVFSDINAVEVKSLLLKEDFLIDLEEFKKFSIINKEDGNSCKLAFICSPNNPTGESQDISVIEDMAKSFGGMLIIDEAYAEFSDKVSATSLINKYPNIVVLKTFSKCYGLAGARVGIMVSSSELCSVMNSVKAPYNVGFPSQRAALDLLKKHDEIIRERDEVVIRRDEYFTKFLTLEIVEKVYKSDANFLLMKTKDSNKICSILQSKGIIIRNRNKVIHCENCVRITIGSKSECERVYKEMSEIVL